MFIRNFDTHQSSLSTGTCGHTSRSHMIICNVLKSFIPINVVRIGCIAHVESPNLGVFKIQLKEVFSILDMENVFPLKNFLFVF